MKVEATTSRWSWGQRIGVIALILSAGLLGTLAVGELLGWRILRGPIESHLSRQVGQAVTLGEGFRLRVIGGIRFSTDHAAMGSAPPWFDATDLHVSLRWRDVMRAMRSHDLSIASLQAQQLTATLLRDAQGGTHWPVRQADRGASPWRIRLQSLALADGDVQWVDPREQTQLRLKVQGGEGHDSSEAAGYRASLTGHWQGKKVALHAQAPRLLPLMHPYEQAEPVPTVTAKIEGQVGSTEVSFEGEAAALLATAQFKGKIAVSGASLASVGDVLGLALPQTGPFSVAGVIEHRPAQWVFKADKIVVGSSRLHGHFNFSQASRPPMLTGVLAGERLALADLRPAISGSGTPALPRNQTMPPAEKRVIPSASFDWPSLRVMDAAIQVNIDRLDLGADALRPFTQLRADLSLNGGVLNIKDFVADVAGGQVRGHTTLNGNTQPAQWQANLAVQGMEISEWAPALKNKSSAPRAVPKKPLQGDLNDRPHDRTADAKAATAPPSATGQLVMAMSVQGQGNSTAQILGSLQGQGRAHLDHGKLSHLITELIGLDLAQSLGVMLRGDELLNSACARLAMRFDRGVATIQQSILDNTDSAVRVDGRIDLASERMDLRAVAHPKDVSLFSLRSPLRITGALSAPQVSVEKGPLVGKALLGLALGSVAGPAALLPFIDVGDKQQAQPCDAARKAAPPASAAAARPPKPGHSLLSRHHQT